jgi:hypothetical protein
MSRRNFSNLSSYDFEILVRDLLSEELQLHLEAFSPGPDTGIDLRALGPTGASTQVRPGATAAGKGPVLALVVQCKHYEGSGFSALKRALKKEKTAIDRLGPQRYLVATSVSMTPGRKDELRALLSPWMHSPADVLGREDLEDLLGRYPQVEKRNYKLWLTSTAVLERVLYNDVLSRTEGYLEDLQRKARVFVQNDSYPRAQEILDEHHVCVISGPPGVGKTTLAEMLLIDYVSQGYEPVIVSHDIGEADALYHSEGLQVFLYDDFLGRTSSLEKLGKNEDDRLLRLIRRVSRTPEKRLLLTTREYILEQARRTYERLNRPELISRKYLLDMESYTRLHRAAILYNHLYFADISSEAKKAILSERAYLPLIEHPNYSPRLIEDALDLASTMQVAVKDFPDHLQRSLDNPQDLWAHVFDNQLDDDQRLLLLLVLTLDPRCLLKDVERAFEAYFAGISTRHDFLVTLRTLEASFLRIGRQAGGEPSIDFANPGIQDFVIGQLAHEPDILKRILQAAVAFEQCALIWNYSRVPPRTSRTRWGAWKLDAWDDWHSIRSIAELPLPAIGERADSTREHQEQAVGSISDANWTYPRLRRLLVDHAQDLLEAMARLLPTQRTAGMSLERRLTIILSAAQDMGTALPPAWLQESLKLLKESWRGKVGDKENALQLLATLRIIMASEELPDQLLAAATSWFSDPLESAEDFQALISLDEMLTDYYGQKESARRARLHLPDKHDLKDQFLLFVDHEMNRLLSEAKDSDALGDGLQAMEDTASLLDLNINESLEEGWRIVTAVEAMQEAEWKDRRGSAPPSGSPSRAREVAAINDMFSTLRDA